MKIQTKVHRTRSVGNQHIQMIETSVGTPNSSWGVCITKHHEGKVIILTSGRDTAIELYYMLVNNAEYISIELN